MNNIQIFKIELNNYRQFQGVEEISLETSPDKHINVIEGQNGSGKSNILNAITLCFYNEEPHIDDSNDRGLGADPVANLKELEAIDVGESVRGHIEITLGKDEPQYIFTRKFRTAKVDNDEYNSVIEDLQLRQKFGADWQNVENPNTRLREILPTRVHQYFLFDGEQLDKFFEEGYTQRVKDAVLDVSHIQLLERGIDHLETMQKDLEREASDVEGKPQELHEEYEDAQDELDELNEKEEDLEENIEEANESIDGIDEELADSTDPDVREKQQRRRYLNERLDDRKEELQNTREDAAISLSRAGPVAYGQDALQYTVELFREREESGEEPPDIPEWWLDQLLDEGECICGTNIENEEEKREHIEHFKKKITEAASKSVNGRRKVQRALDRGDDLVDQAKERKRRVEDIKDDIDDINDELLEISAELESKTIPDDVDVAELEKQRKRIDGRIKDMREDLGQLRGKIEQKKEEVEERKKAWQREVEREKKHETILRKISFVENASEKIEGIEKEILEQVRTETEDSLEQFFNDLIWKDEPYDIELTDEYEVHVYGPSGEKNLGSLSAGERQVLALSFMSALAQISGFSAPILIDTPLGRISSKPKKRIAQNVPNYLEDTQVTFLMTDEEYTDEVRVFLKDKVANEYHLDYSDEVTEVPSP
ncbi:AAA family ATPase [Halorubrum sp. Atlit-28R]|uniref:AAA family ATPase n=1 Tax=Halorubrum sp. Atlit-28R TaxID=2282129 RepID=UPI000EF1C0FD|nr:AAA family ATPase [Halorubrum sp. Atlit-28R]RLM49669.1 chromosome segregation protein [Halorubrum sp. Atlit-28R]